MGKFELMALPYALDALEPVISKQTLEFHHGKHLAGYVNNLNVLLEGSPLADYRLVRHRTALSKQITMIHSCPELMDLIQEVGFLPLLDSGIRGYSAEEVVDEDNRYVVLEDGGWDWPLWKWKGPIVTEGRCVYGKFFAGKAGFVSKDWWPDLCNYRRASRPAPEEGSIEEAILLTLAKHGSLITRELRAACGFDGPKMRSKFDGYVTRLQMACRIVTEDFVYPTDIHGREYGWGWSLLTTPERLLGREMCQCERTPQESFERMFEHLHKLLPNATDKQITKLIK